MALLSPFGWPFELFVHFRVQYAAASLLLAPILIWLRRPVYAAGAAVLALFHAWPVLSHVPVDPPAAACTGPVFTVVSANVRFRNDDHRLFLDWLEAHPADLVVVQEVTEAWADELARLADYPHRTLLVREDPYGIGVLSRWPLEATEPADFAGDGLPSLVGRVRVSGQELLFLGLHTHWPLAPALAKARDDSLQRAAALIRSQALPAVALGDLNLTPHSPMFERFLSAAGLRDTLEGGYWQPTWQAGFWPLALRIDYVLVSAGVCVVGAETGPSIGSDHRPVIARLTLGSARLPGALTQR